MNDRQLTDAQIAAALRAHLPAEAPPGLRLILRDAIEATAQQRPLVPIVTWRANADPIDMRRGLLLLFALLLAAMLAGLAAAGAWRVIEHERPPDLDLTKPDAVAALVASTYARMPEMPAVAIAVDNGGTKERIYVDRSGAVRFDYYATRLDTSPDAYRILSGTTMGELVNTSSGQRWVEQDGAISEDPRVFLVAELEGNGVRPGCEVSVPAPVGWTYVETEDVSGRPAYHVACGGGDLWIDRATRLILRSRGPARPDVVLGPDSSIRTVEVTGLEFRDQAADLFRIFQPAGVPSMSVDAYQCQFTGVACPATPVPSRAPGPGDAWWQPVLP